MYTRPMVMVFQEYASTSGTTSTASLPPCIVGPCFHIVDNVEDEALALYGDYSEVGIDSGFIPNNAPGALIEADSVKIRLKNANVRIGEGLLVTADATSLNVLTLADTAVVSNFDIGDYVEFSDVTDPLDPKVDPVQLRVIGVNTDTDALILNKTFALADPDNTRVAIYRKVEEILVPYDSPYITLDVSSERFSIVGVKHSFGAAEYPVASAELYVGYKALRQDLSDVLSISDVNEISGKLGKISPENPLAFGVSIAMANASIAIKCIGVDSDDLEGYTAAKDRLENHDPVYAIVPLTMSPGVLSMFKNHCVEMSDPMNGAWRIALGSSELVTSKEISTGAGKVSKDGDGDLVVLTAVDPDVTFLSNNVDAGDTLHIMDAGGKEHTYTVSSVVSEDMLTVTQSAAFDPATFQEGTEYTFRIVHELDKLAQAEEIAATSRSYGSNRFVHVWPNRCVVNSQELPGYYLCCALAGGIGGLPSHQGFTRLSVSGIDAVRNANDYFNNDQLDTIADGGTLIFVQASSTAPPHIRHQLTTDRSTLEMQELSFVKNFDYISYMCRDTMDAFLGKYNINKSTLATLRTALGAVLETLKLDTSPKIGSRVIDYAITKVEQHADMRDRVEMYVDLQMPYPLNTIGVHLRSTTMQIVSSA